MPTVSCPNRSRATNRSAPTALNTIVGHLGQLGHPGRDTGHCPLHHRGLLPAMESFSNRNQQIEAKPPHQPEPADQRGTENGQLTPTSTSTPTRTKRHSRPCKSSDMSRSVSISIWAQKKRHVIVGLPVVRKIDRFRNTIRLAFQARPFHRLRVARTADNHLLAANNNHDVANPGSRITSDGNRRRSEPLGHDLSSRSNRVTCAAFVRSNAAKGSRWGEVLEVRIGAAASDASKLRLRFGRRNDFVCNTNIRRCRMKSFERVFRRSAFETCFEGVELQ